MGIFLLSDVPPIYEGEVNNVVEILQSLIAIPSVNPDGDPGAEGTGEKRMADYLSQILEDLGAEVAQEEVETDRPNVIGRFPSVKGEEKPHVLLGPHLDTVGVSHMTIDPFSGEHRDGRIYGRGACDTKGTMAAMLMALKELGSDIARLPVRLSFVGFMGEETNQPGSRDFAARHASEFDFAVIGEPTELDVVHVHKGSLWAHLTTRGKAVHGSAPELGKNAILGMADVMRQLDGPFRELLAGFSHPVLGKSTINIGTIEGGRRTNIVPDKCTISVDIRLTPDLAGIGARGFFLDFLDALEDTPEAEIVMDCGPLDTDADNRFVQVFLKNGARPAGAPWFCDAAHLAKAGLPGVAAGPGSIAQAHTEDEWIDVEQLRAGVDFYRRFLENC